MNPHQTSGKTKLEKKFAFWYRISEETLASTKLLNQTEYEDQVKKIAEFDTIEDFWSIYQHLKKPDACKSGIELQLFKEPIKPMWEDDGNKNGGKFSLKVKKEFTSIIWEEILILFIGGTLSDSIKDLLNGVIVSVRKEFNIIQIWFKSLNNQVLFELEQKLREVLQIPESVDFDVKPFNKQSNTNTFSNKPTYQQGGKKK